MKFIIGGEDLVSYVERMSYNGVIGLFYKGTINGILAYIIAAAITIFAVIGIITTLKLLLFGKKKKSKNFKYFKD